MPQLSRERAFDHHQQRSADDFLLQPHTFKRIAPVTCYEDIQPYIQRIAEGDKLPILAGCPVTELLRRNCSLALSPIHKEEFSWLYLLPALVCASPAAREVFDPKVRKAMERQVEGPDPALALQVEEECCRPPAPMAGYHLSALAASQVCVMCFDWLHGAVHSYA
ncbi:hypothetical protein GOP47_0014394 [Adiantum capillus-veneris]|uniref:Uncharacterized protein n=1 Tax=Adiantum capillus-veneris TaxID=13818 RepID=A0A9D4UM73_ADICA|nr:hypothetical protein GOP47_0014394 [Adiantum capillus-veneris]